MKYELIEWPQSQEFVGHPDCYLVNPLCWNTEQDSQAYFVPENIILELKTQNKSMFEIETMFEQYNYYNKLVRESMRNYLSKELIDTSEDNPRIKSICLINAKGFGLSTPNFHWIHKLWQNPTEGVIYFAYDNEDIVEFDYMSTEDLLTICKYLK
jgi:hypothetical protein